MVVYNPETIDISLFHVARLGLEPEFHLNVDEAVVIALLAQTKVREQPPLPEPNEDEIMMLALDQQPELTLIVNSQLKLIRYFGQLPTLNGHFPYHNNESMIMIEGIEPEKVVDYCQQVLDSGESPTLGFDIMVEQELKHLQVAFQPVFKKDEIIAVRLTISDITERIHLHNLVESLRDRLEMLGKMLAVNRHELRGPISRLTTGSQVATRAIKRLSDELKKSSPTEEQLDLINRSSEVVERITDANIAVKNVLDGVSMLERILINPSENDPPVRLHLPSLATYAAQVCGLTAVNNSESPLLFRSSAGHEVEFSINTETEDSVAVQLNTIQFILKILLDNALKYTPSGKKIVVSLTAELEELLTLQVSDKGIGIPEAELGNIFEANFRASNATNHEGSGLGLDLCYFLVNTAGGRIQVQSVVNEGSIFTVMLPHQSGF
jgi:signal transduction histidine kinase